MTINANDLNTNLRTASTAETFVATLTEVTSTATHTPAITANGDGTYSFTHLFQVVDDYTLDIKFSSTAIDGSQLSGIVVTEGLV